jgi:DNA invertase Pin-like site-specific DNA recombinase
VSGLIPAAEYLRMSTDHQQYSITNQATRIREYAYASGFEIVRTYQDPGRSGLSFKNRPGLAQLLQDVVSGTAAYKAVLVYDVSRWGRFQDVDEAAHYEYLCKAAKVPVHYCAEQFANDGTLSDAILKGLKRAMAAEYSRELGVRVYRGQRHLVQLGFKMGGCSTYGLRRLLVSTTGASKQLLERGERKGLQSDRVIIVPGPESETAIVQEIFAMAIQDRMRPLAIARRLNERGVQFSALRKDWDRQNVANILHNPIYTGCNTWGRTSQRMKGKLLVIPRSEWIIKHGAFQPLIDLESFEAAQTVLVWRKTDEELLEGLKGVWRTHGAVTQDILGVSEDAPTYSTCCAHFGSLENALALIGYRHQRNDELARQRSVRFQRIHRGLINRLVQLFPNRLEAVSRAWSPRRTLRLDGRLIISIQLVVARQTSAHHVSWRIHPVPSERNNLTLCCYLDTKNERVVGRYFVNGFPATPKRSITIRPDDPTFQQVQLTTLSKFCGVALETECKH